MTDNLSPEDRSRCMSHIRSQGMKPERVVRSIVHRAGYRFRLHRRDLPGKPDLVLPRHHAIIFVNGCFWHWHPDPACPIAGLPKSNLDYWRPKLARTRDRDREHEAALTDLGWRVFTVWECGLRDLDATSCAIERFIESGEFDRLPSEARHLRSTDAL
ncbi:MAG: very short patch repair endonuclease [Chloroflexota bacterium]|nr:very short patch repair endonuclease [Chloroflexota bacterium]